jgi:hypothetical protein
VPRLSHPITPTEGPQAVEATAFPLTRPPAPQGGTAGAVDTALATPGYGYAAYLRHFVIYTYCAVCAKHSPLRDDSVLGLGLSTLS